MPDTGGERRYKWEVSIDPEKSVRVSVRWITVKEISDTEVWTSIVPTSHLDLSIDMQIRDLEWDVDSIHHGTTIPLSGDVRFGMNDFTIREPLLPFHGVHVWWRPRRPPPLQIAAATSEPPGGGLRPQRGAGDPSV
jgi:hypothetical protein